MVPQSTRKTEQQNHSEFEAMAAEVREYGKKTSETMIVRDTGYEPPFIHGSYQTHLISPSLDVRGVCPSEN